MDASQIRKRAWSYAGVLQDVGLSCFEYVEQLTLLLFLKMADLRVSAPPRFRDVVSLCASVPRCVVGSVTRERTPRGRSA
jgi:hypothetical protein